MDCPVRQIDKQEDGYCLHTGKGKIRTRCVINAAGIYADVFNNMVSEEQLRITPRRGEYLLLDKRAGSYTQHTIFQMPGPMGKGSADHAHRPRQSAGGTDSAGCTGQKRRLHDGGGTFTGAKKSMDGIKSPAASRDHHILCRTSGT